MQARADAIQAGKDAAAAARAAADAARIAEQKRREEETQRRNDYSAGLPVGEGVDPDIDYSDIRSDEDVLNAENEALVAPYREANTNANRSVMDLVVSLGGQFLLDVIGWTDAEACFTKGDIAGCLFTALNALGPLKLLALGGKLPRLGKTIWRIAEGVRGFQSTVRAARDVLRRSRKIIDEILGYLRNPCGPNSFTAGTKVLMADGTGKPIEAVDVGDQVQSTDPATGRTGPQPVTALITGSGRKSLTSVTVGNDGLPGALGLTGTVQATSTHPFWVNEPGHWRDARELRPGDQVRRPDGHYVTVTATHPWTAERKVYNLTVRGYHTFYVLAGGIAVLVHNSGGAKYCNIGKAGEAAVSSHMGGAAKNTTKYTVNGRDRIPDFVTPTIIGESKNVAWLGGRRLETQLEDYLELARQQGKELHIFVRANGGTKLSERMSWFIHDAYPEVKIFEIIV
ncbi:polymorphic toxin-type HINT domain-containing protein [Actinomadura violacea]|uniref:Hint domain-containing protein n=1 Tax=Actinomadura violacea TaxID=2819934 RepID=A0ABS3S071_9ACTN|nr:polymorphic toxin-type HINT domain-containing protein [Actinomadura violacea]MBO2462402.1 hypothetical protein [Actinomadura violacea]